MPYLALTLSGQPVDLPPDAEVALSYRANDLRTLDSREGAFSEQFTLPRTARNAAVLGSPHVLDNQSTAPYRLLPAVLTSPGGTELLRGFAVVERASGDGYDVTLTDALGGLCAQVGNHSLRSLNLSAYDHPYSMAVAQISQARAYTQGYAYALADAGTLAGRAVDTGVLWTELVPAVFYHAVLTALVARALPGYRLTGTLLNDPLYQALVLPRATPFPQLRPAVTAPYAVRVRSQGDHLERAPAGSFSFPLIPFTQQLEGTARGWTEYQHYHTPPFPADIRVTARLLVRLDAANVASSFALVKAAVRVVDVADTTGRYQQEQIVLEAVGSYFAVLTASQPAGFRAMDFDFTLPAHPAGRQLAVQLRLEGGAGLVVGAGSVIAFAVGPRTYPTAPVHLDASLPDISQADWLKLLVTQGNVLIQADAANRTVRFDLFNTLEANRGRAVDWTDRLDTTTAPSTAFTLGEYAQTNTFNYDAPPKQYDELLLGAPAALGHGTGILYVPNATRPATAEGYAAPVVLPLARPTMGGAASLLWLPQLAEADPRRPAQPWKAGQPYTAGDYPVIYRGETWACGLDAALARTVAGSPPQGGPVTVETGPAHTPQISAAWQRLPYAVANDELPAVCVLVPAPAIPGLKVRDDAPGTAAFFPAVALSRAGLEWDALLPRYHAGLQRLLARCRVITVNLRLRAVDIAALDYARPIRLDAAHLPGYGQVSGLFYLNHIDQYRPGSTGAVAVELVLLGAPIAGLAPAAAVPVLPV